MEDTPAVLSDARAQDLADAKAWLCARWCQDHPNEQHIKQLADYAAHLRATPPASDVAVPAGPFPEGAKPLVYSSALAMFADNEATVPHGYEIWVHTTSPLLPTQEDAYAWAKQYVAAAAPKVASDTTMPFGLPLSDTDLTRLYEGSKRDALPVGSEVRQLVAEVRYHRGNSIPVAYLLTKAGSFEEFSRSPLTDADKAGGWTETPLYVRSGHSL